MISYRFKVIQYLIYAVLGLSCLSFISAEENNINCKRYQLGWKDCSKQQLLDREVIRLEKALENMLDECSEMIGSKEDDYKKGVLLPQGTYIFISMFPIENYDELIRLQPSYLRGRYYKCADFVMKNRTNRDDFEFSYALQLTELQKEVEDKLEYIYLYMRKNIF